MTTQQREGFPPNFRAQAPASESALSAVREALPATIGDDYFAFLATANGGEGFIGDSYVVIYSTDDVLALNRAYEVHRFAPGLVLFGSNGGGEAFAFDSHSQAASVVQVPFIPLRAQLAEPLGNSFSSFLEGLLAAQVDPPPEINDDTFGMEVHEIKPVVFGGDPTDHGNKALIPRPQHPPLVVFWNDTYQKVTGQ